MVRSPLASHAASPAELKARIEAERRGVPFLVYRDGDGKQRLFDLDAAGVAVSVGRGPLNGLPLEWDVEVSRTHAELERVGADWTIVDDGLSRNGSYVNGTRVRGKRRLRDGDALRLGETVLVYRGPADRQSQPTAAAAEDAVPEELSKTQRAVLIALCRPLRDESTFATPATNQQIADELCLTVDAVKKQLRALFKKLAVEDLPHNRKRAELAGRAFRTGLISSRDLLS